MLGNPFIDSASGRLKLTLAVPTPGQGIYLRGFLVNPASGALVRGSAPRSGFIHGLPITNSTALVFGSGPVVRHGHPGIPYNSLQEIAVDLVAPVTYHQNGIPYTAAGLIAAINI